MPLYCSELKLEFINVYAMNKQFSAVLVVPILDLFKMNSDFASAPSGSMLDQFCTMPSSANC
jgi:hypothetical protein